VTVAATKSTDVDVVTEADRSAELLIRERIAAARPDDAVLGEEGDDLPGTSGVRWVVDPIDGTVNFLYGLPQYAVSVAAELDGEVVAGAVINAATRVEYVATRGGGAARDGVPLRVRENVPLSQRLVITGFAVVTVAAAFLHDRKGPLRILLGVLVAAGAIGTIVYVVLTGDAGAQAVYGQ
jgi:myo-inositol-1(or 4)-monophosphatase